MYGYGFIITHEFLERIGNQIVGHNDFIDRPVVSGRGMEVGILIGRYRKAEFCQIQRKFIIGWIIKTFSLEIVKKHRHEILYEDYPVRIVDLSFCGKISAEVI